MPRTDAFGYIKTRLSGQINIQNDQLRAITCQLLIEFFSTACTNHVKVFTEQSINEYLAQILVVFDNDNAHDKKVISKI